MHYQDDLVLFPSIGSEGSSLSLAEAMAAGCAIVSSNEGSLSHMIIDQFNGLMMMPDVNMLTARLDYCLQHPIEAKRIALQAHTTAISSLSLLRWQQDCRKYFMQFGFDFRQATCQ